MAWLHCPTNSFGYNGTLCACNPGYFMVEGSCELFGAAGGDWVVRSGVEASPTFLETALYLDSIERMVRSQAALLKATVVVLLFWLAFCAAVRFGRVDGGRTIWFRARWWISRMDLRFATKHLLVDGKMVTKRKTELGGTFSVASWILFVGLLSALLYQIITNGTTEVHRVKPTSFQDLLSFVNDMEFNITTISSMSCSQLRGLDTLVIGTPGFIDYRISPLSNYANYSCYNTSRGPTISLKCNSCQVPFGDHYISWQFVDLPNSPATAVGFQFNLTAKDHGNDRHVSFVGGTLTSGTYMDDRPRTFRGPDMNILKIHLFPQKFNNLQNLKLIQPIFYDFLPGSSFSDLGDLQVSLQSAKDGLVNTTLYMKYLSDYIVEIDKENVFGPVSFLADVGGLYAVSSAIFLYFLLQCEGRIKKLRCEDHVMRNIRSQRRAQRHWDKLRKYVRYTWGRSNLNLTSRSGRHGNIMIDSFRRFGSLHKLKQPSSRYYSVCLGKVANMPSETTTVPEATLSESSKSNLGGSTTKFGQGDPHLEDEHEIVFIKEDLEKQQSTAKLK